MINNRIHQQFLKSKTRYIAVVLIFLISLCSCGNTSQNIPEVSGIKISLQAYRFDKDLYAIDTNHIGDGLKQLSAKYPDFLNFFLDTMMGYAINSNYNDTCRGIREGLKVFLTYKDFVGLEDTINKHYPDTKDIEHELVNGFQFMKYYYSAYNAPKVLFVTLGLRNLPAFTIDSSILGIGLDMFLGEQYLYYRSIGIYDYMSAHLRRSYIPVAAFKVIYSYSHPFAMDDRTLLDLMLQRGKEQYFLHKILPRTPDSVLFGFTQDQVDWCNENQASIYNFFVQHNLLYNKESQAIVPYVNDGPFAPGLPASGKIKSTPGNVGSWIGYKIVCAYMEQHPKITLKDLCNEQTDPAKFLDEARYRPK